MRDTIEAYVGGSMYAFRLTLPAAIDLERDCARLGDDGKWTDHPLGELAKEVDGNHARAAHVAATVRAGLHSDERGIVTPARSAQIVGCLVDTRPLVECAGLASLVLVASLTTARMPTSSGRKRAGKNQPLSRGDVLANCAAIGIDWQTLTLAAYAEVVAVHQQRNSDPNGKPGVQPPSDEFRAFFKRRLEMARAAEKTASAA